MITDLAALNLPAPEANLQAYNQADNYLLNELNKIYTGQKIALVNEQYGALACALQALNPVCYNDSAIYQSWLAHYLNKHTLVQHSIDKLTDSQAELFLVKLPKNQHFFAYQLSLLSCLPNITVIVAGMQKYWPASFYQLAYDYFDEVEVLLGVKKAKCMILRSGKHRNDINPIQRVSLPDFDLELLNYPNVFSRDKLDIGSRFLMENLPELSQEQTLLDLACGNGVLGILAQKKYPQLFAHYVDESHFAMQSCQASLQANLITEDRYQLHHNNGLEGLTLNNIDVILCNPPFHQEHLISESTAITMIEQASRCLSAHGQLLLVANRHLAYYAPLKKHFKQVTTLTSNRKFIIYQASQPKH
jgi:23S rRNA (guanine1835-N2)-methyltransferase